MNRILSLNSGFYNHHETVNAKVRVNPVTKENKVLFTEEGFGDKPWEVRYDNSYPNLFYDPLIKKYRLYYTLFCSDTASSTVPLKERKQGGYRPRSDRITGLAYAESSDGIHFTKPNLQIVEFNGTKDNNLLKIHCHGASVLLDLTETDENKRYKMICKVDYSSAVSYMGTAFSKDGIHFSDFIKWDKYHLQADTYNYAFKDKFDGKYKLITRQWHNSLRVVSLLESNDFLNWSEPREILRGISPEAQIYSMPVFQLDDLYLGLASIYHEGNRLASDFDTTDVELKYATNLDYFDSVEVGVPFIPKGKGSYPEGVDSGCIYASVPVEIDDKLYFYYMGGNGRHTDFRETSFMRSFIEKDKFSYLAPLNEEEAIVRTTKLNFYGENLKVLADVETDGYIEAEIVIQNEESTRGVKIADEYKTRLVYQDGYYVAHFDKKLTDLANTLVCIKFYFKKAKIYAFYGDFALSLARY